MHYFAVQEWSHDLNTWVITHITADAQRAHRIRRNAITNAAPRGTNVPARVIVAKEHHVRAFCGVGNRIDY